MGRITGTPTGTESLTFWQTRQRSRQDRTKRDHYRIVLDAINAVIEGRATQAEEEFSIAGRSLRRTPLKDLLGFKLQYERLLAASQEQEKIDNGEHSEAGMVHYRFQNPYGRILPH